MGAEYDSRTDGVLNSADVSGNVFSLFTEIKLPIEELKSKYSFIFRYDSSDPNEDKLNDKTGYFIAGFAWKALEKITIVLNRQMLTSESATMKTKSGTFTDKDEKWFVNAIISF